MNANMKETDIMMATEMKQNKMGIMPIPKLLLNMGLPMMISMLGQALYNVVDTFFVSHMPDTAGIEDIGDKAINALTLAYPVQMLIIAFGVGTGVGINALLSRTLGEGNKEKASKIAGNAITISLIYFAVTALFGILGAKAFILSQTRDTVIVQMGTTYLQIVTIFSLGTIGYMCIEKVVMATGNTVATMIGQLSGAVANIILDPIMIYGLLGCPVLGVAGAAWATVIGQFVSLIVIIVFLIHDDKEIRLGLRFLLLEKNIVRNIFSIGLPAIIMQILVPVMSYVMNLILGTISVSAVTAYGVYYKLQNFIFMPAYGLNNASIPIISFNYGAQMKKRISDAVRYGLYYVTAIMLLGFLLLQIFAKQIVGVFSIADESAQLCILSLHIITCGFFFAGINIILQGVCQAMGKGTYSLIISLLRFLIVALPLAYIFSLLQSGSTYVWAALPIAEGIACIAAVILSKKACRSQKL
jgi:multidrug efflux pump